jgi:polyisoprenoid-binding protein YceI
MKKVCLSAFLFLGIFTTNAQQKLITQTGKITFDAGTGLEDIVAVNKGVSAAINPKTGKMQFKMDIAGFEFKRQLMQDHFNENYMESEKYPNAGFIGNITNIDKVNFGKDGKYKVQVKGILEIHGVKNEVETEGFIQVKGKEVNSQAEFAIQLDDYKINVPRVVKDKLSNTVKISVDCDYTSK